VVDVGTRKWKLVSENKKEIFTNGENIHTFKCADEDCVGFPLNCIFYLYFRVFKSFKIWSLEAEFLKFEDTAIYFPIKSHVLAI